MKKQYLVQGYWPNGVPMERTYGQAPAIMPNKRQAMSEAGRWIHHIKNAPSFTILLRAYSGAREYVVERDKIGTTIRWNVSSRSDGSPRFYIVVS